MVWEEELQETDLRRTKENPGETGQEENQGFLLVPGREKFCRLGESQRVGDQQEWKAGRE